MTGSTDPAQQRDHESSILDEVARAGDLLQSVRLVEALLFASAEPLTESMLRQRLPVDHDLSRILDDLGERYRDRGVNLTRVGQGWAFRTAPDLADQLRLDVLVRRRLSQAAIETLAIIAYHQPVTRSEIEAVRGVAVSRGTLDVLLEAGWIRPRGRRETPGRPLQWWTTGQFLDHFGLKELTDLPGLDDLKAAGLLDKPSGPVLIEVGETAEPPEEPGDLLSLALDRNAEPSR